MSFEVENEDQMGPEIAVIGLAGRFPGADSVQELWELLASGREGMADLTDDDLRAAGVPEEHISDPAYVRRIGALRDIEHFDAAFFGYSPREAEALEPGHRIFLECAWEALENAGCDPSRFPGQVGVYAGSGEPQYTQTHILPRPEIVAALGHFQVNVGSNKDFFATRTAYKLDLRGPAVGVQTGCSTSLVAVHLAAQSLLSRECDLALAGGASVSVPHRAGYLWEPGGIMSQDGRCRAFDAKSTGTQGGNGVGVVVLKRLADALRDGDTIHAVIKGSAINNDGALKVAFTAPSVEGQAAVIGEALAVADVDAETIRYVEGHGSGTELGDPIEIAALTEAFRAHTDRTGFCAVGSVKASVGHLDSAAGITGFIKTVLALENRVVPPTPHFETPNPKIDFARSPFYVSARAEPWERNGAPRRAGVSSFGIGGTNAHVVLEEAPEPQPSTPRRPWSLLVLSARTPTALDAATARLAEHFRQHPDTSLAEAAHTLQVGRRQMAHRRMLVVRDGEDAAALLQARHPDRVVTGSVDESLRSVAFLFPGVGDQYPQMARGLYATEPAFREAMDRCAAVLSDRFGIDLLAALYPGEAPAESEPGAKIDMRRMLAREETDPAAEALNRTEMAQPAVFAVEYALAQLWLSWGITPRAVAGHSLGEYVAATIAGVFTLEDALELVTARGRMIQALPAGAMLAVPLSADAVKQFLDADTSVATINAPEMCVVAGPVDAVEGVRARLADAGHVARTLAATHAFHSPMLDSLVEPVRELVSGMKLSSPSIPMISNVTGTWITAAQATDAGYWARHLREPVQFERGVTELLKEPGRVLLEVGPGQTLSTFVRQRPDSAGVAVIPTVRYPYDRTSDAAFALGALGRLWLAGITPDWNAFHDGESLRRIPLPTYPWERQRYWVEAPKESTSTEAVVRGGRRGGPADWIYTPVWKRTPAVQVSGDGDAKRWMLFHDGGAWGHALAAALRARGCEVAATVLPGERFARTGDGAYTVRPEARDDYDALVAAVRGDDTISALTTWPMADAGAQGRGFVHLALLAGALGRDREMRARLVAVTARGHDVTGAEAEIDPFAATVAGGAVVVAQEHPALTAVVVDVENADAALAPAVAAEAINGGDTLVALRGRRRWVRGFEPVRPPARGAGITPGETWLLLGGMDGRSEVLARWLGAAGARLVLAAGKLPDRGTWDAVVHARLPDDPIRQQIEAIRGLEAAGVQVLTLHTQLYSATQVDEAFRAAEQRFGPVDGVVLSPSLQPLLDFEALGETAPSEWARFFGIMTAEMDSLRSALANRSVPRVFVESSLTPLLGSVGHGRVAAADSFVDAYATRRDLSGAWTVLAWDRWFTPDETAEGYGMTVEQGAEVFGHALALAGEPHMVLSTGSVAARMAESARPAAVTPAAGSYARPELETEYFPPQTDAEQVVAAMWQELIGIDRIGIHDDFFGLGGHSLLATQIISRTRDQFGLELPLKAVFEAPTVAKYAELVEQAIMAEIEGMTADEIMSLV